MIKPRTSPIWAISKEELVEIAKRSTTISDVLLHFNLLNKGGNYKTLQKRFEEDMIDFNHIKLGINSNKGRVFIKEKFSLARVLVEHSTYNRNTLKKRLIEEGLLKNECYVCGQLPIWNNLPLSLQIDHINGVSDDNRIENLRILCPHCHSQTDNFAGKNKAKPIVISNRIKIQYNCIDCNELLNDNRGKRCRKCNGIDLSTKNHSKFVWPSNEALLNLLSKNTVKQISKQINIPLYSLRKHIKNNNLVIIKENNWPTKDILSVLLWEKPIGKIATQFNVNHKQIAYWATKYGLDRPLRGYWGKNKA